MTMEPSQNEIALMLLHRETDPEELTQRVLRDWRKQGGDVAFFLPHLADIGVTAQVSSYQNMRPTVQREGEQVVSSVRRGRVVSCVANKDVFSFGLRVKDEAVEVTEGDQTSVGAFRTFAMLDVHGEVYQGWSNLTLEGELEAEERSWFDHDTFVDSRRWQQITSDLYCLTKITMQRLKEQAKFIRSERDRLAEAGYRVERESTGQSRGEQRTIRTETLLAEVDHPWVFVGDFPGYGDSTEEWERANKDYNNITYKLIPSLRYYTRVIEYAFYCYGPKDEWEEVRIKKTKWKAKTAEEVRDGSVNVRHRIMTKSTRVSA